jgi:hypothetical protein
MVGKTGVSHQAHLPASLCPSPQRHRAIGRALEETIALAKTQTRLSRNLGRPELRGHLDAAVLRAGGARIEARRLLVLDISDIAKPYAEKRQYLAWVRDGSTADIADGDWLCQVIGVANEAAAIVPLYSALSSQKAPDFQSENEETKTAFSQLAAACEGRGVWVVERGGDRRELYKPLLAGAQCFIIRTAGERHVLAGRHKVEAAVLAAQCPMIYATPIVREEKG